MKNAILIILCFIFFGNLYPQQTDSVEIAQELKYDRNPSLQPVEFNTSKIEEYRNSQEFDYLNIEEKESWWTRFKKWINAWYNKFINWVFGDYKANRLLAFFIAIFPYLVLFLLVGIIAWLFSRLNPGGRMLETVRNSEVFLTEEEELVKNEDLQGLMREAVKNGNFRLAVRYYYLNELSKLDRLNLIEYEFQKTNRDYINELKDEIIRKHFTEVTKLYEFIWYGSFKVSEADFRLAEKGFVRMDKTLESHRHE